MTNKRNSTRRSFLQLTGTTALASITALSGSSKDKDSKNSVKPLSDLQQHQEWDGEKADNNNDRKSSSAAENFEKALKASAFNLYDDLSMRGFNAGTTQLVDVKTQSEGHENYAIEVNVDLNSIFHTEGMAARDQDLHKAQELGLVDEMMSDVEGQLNELAGMVQDNLEDFYSEVGMNDTTRVNVEVDIRGADNSSYEFIVNTLKEDVSSATEDFIKNPYENSIHGFSPGEYEGLKMMDDGSELTLTGGEGDKHTIEYLQEGVFKINGGPLQQRGEGELLGRFGSRSVRVQDIDPIYIQERDRANGSVELEIEGREEGY